MLKYVNSFRNKLAAVGTVSVDILEEGTHSHQCHRIDF